MELDDVRRLTGANLLWDRAGAVGEAALPAGEEGLVVALWRRQARRLLDAVGWVAEEVAVRPYPGGASLAVSAPLDALYAATDLLEAAWRATAALYDNAEEPAFDEIVAELRRAIAEESNPGLVALHDAAARRGVVLLHGEDQVSLGLGTGCQAWPEDALPKPDAVDWDAIHDIPLALVTGTNGKSTTVRLAAAMGAAAGRAVGLCSSDWIRVAGEVVDEGDYSGPSGARQTLRHPRAELAVLEVARGGLLRRGLQVPRADACLITNVAADHLGDYGVNDLASLTEAKFLIARAVRPGGRLILNADDPGLVARASRYDGQIVWFTLDGASAPLTAWLKTGGEACFVEDGQFVLARGGDRAAVLAIDDFPLALGGRARHNVANALGAIALAAALGLPVPAMAEGLAGFSGGPEANPGRGNIFTLGGITAVVDFAHNPHGLAALLAMLEDLPAKRRLILLGQAGDRSDSDIRALTRTAWGAGPDRIIVKEMAEVLRGRAPGEVPALINRELASLGAPPEAIAQAPSEMDAVRQAFAWSEPGDLLILLLHTQRKAALALLQSLQGARLASGRGARRLDWVRKPPVTHYDRISCSGCGSN